MIAVIKNTGAGSVEGDTTEELRQAFLQVNAKIELLEDETLRVLPRRRLLRAIRIFALVEATAPWPAL